MLAVFICNKPDTGPFIIQWQAFPDLSVLAFFVATLTFAFSGDGAAFDRTGDLGGKSFPASFIGVGKNFYFLFFGHKVFNLN